LAFDEKRSKGLRLSSQQNVLSVFSKIRRKLENDGVRGLVDSIIQKLFQKDDHMYHLTYNQLLDLFEKTGWSVVKEHWQKPPYDFCIYVSLTK
ncbi:MAG: hypothetical protein NT118_09845, partial [Lentisphaerae bacterium]|nr:hypothetical protein [Lentisphaerota bacterium]